MLALVPILPFVLVLTSVKLAPTKTELLLLVIALISFVSVLFIIGSAIFGL